MSADDAILSEIEDYVLHSDVVERAVVLALDELRPPAEVVESERHRLLTELRTLERELEQLTTGLPRVGTCRRCWTGCKPANAVVLV